MYLHLPGLLANQTSCLHDGTHFQALLLPSLSQLHALTVCLAVAPPFPFPAIHLCLYGAPRLIFPFFSPSASVWGTHAAAGGRRALPTSGAGVVLVSLICLRPADDLAASCSCRE